MRSFLDLFILLHHLSAKKSGKRYQRIIELKEPILWSPLIQQLIRTLADDRTTKKILWLKETVTAIRNIRGEMDISPVKKIPIIISRGTEEDRSNLETFGSDSRSPDSSRINNLERVKRRWASGRYSNSRDYGVISSDGKPDRQRIRTK